MRLMKFVCSFAWTDLKVQQQERDLVMRIAGTCGSTATAQGSFFGSGPNFHTTAPDCLSMRTWLTNSQPEPSGTHWRQCAPPA